MAFTMADAVMGFPAADRSTSRHRREISFLPKYRVRRYGRFGGIILGSVSGENIRIVASM